MKVDLENKPCLSKSQHELFEILHCLTFARVSLFTYEAGIP